MQFLGLSRTFWRLWATIGGLAAAAVLSLGHWVAPQTSRPDDVRRTTWLLTGGVGVVSAVIAWTSWRRWARPIETLTEAAAKIADGEYGQRIYVSAPDEVGRLAAAFHQMSERLAVQFAQLDEDRQQLRAVLSGMVEGVVAIDGEQRILFANDRAAQLLEFQPAAAVGRKLWEVVRQRPIQEIVQAALADTGTASGELEWNGPETKSLTVRVAQLAGSPARGAVVVLHDTTELRRLERLRQEFVANVSHELKTPLSVIKACVETLQDGAVDDVENRGPFLEQLVEQADRLHLLILDLLSLARIEAGTEVFEFEAVAVAPLVAACLERHRTRAEAKGLRLEAVPPVDGTAGQPPAGGPEDGRLCAWADAEAVGQILDNLVDNAVKYTPEGGRIRVRWGLDGDQVLLQVEDTGIGIPERDLPRIFERFYRVDKARSRELGGTGLGLSIVKHLVQAMQGTVRATSQLGKGSTFSVRLPRAASA